MEYVVAERLTGRKTIKLGVSKENAAFMARSNSRVNKDVEFVVVERSGEIDPGKIVECYRNGELVK